MKREPQTITSLDARREEKERKTETYMDKTVESEM